jgi:ABC-type amino acid transport substrate-binding protein
MASNDTSTLIAVGGLVVGLLGLVVQVLALPRQPAGGTAPPRRSLGSAILGAVLPFVLIAAALIYLGGTYMVPSPFSQSALKRIQYRKTITIGVNYNAGPFGRQASEAADPEGFDVAIGRAIAGAMDVKPVWKRANAAERRTDAYLRGNDIDLVISILSINVADGRQEVLAFSDPYYLSGQRILTLKDSDIRDSRDLAGRRVCIVTVGRTATLANLTRTIPSALTVRRDNIEQCVTDLRQGRVDAISSDEWLLLRVMQEQPDTPLELRGRPLTKDVFGIGVRKSLNGYGELLAAVNSALQHVEDDGGWTNAYNANIRPFTHEDGQPPAG